MPWLRSHRLPRSATSGRTVLDVRRARRLPSIVQNALAPMRKERDASHTRLLLCGSAMSFMGRLLGGGAPLRGRAGLELVVQTLDYRRAAEFWGIDDPATALKVNAIVGGTPAYRALRTTPESVFERLPIKRTLAGVI